MNFDLNLFLIAVGLLWAPFPILSSKFKLRALQTRYVNPEVGRVLGNWQNYLDLIRGLAGTCLLVHLSMNLRHAPAAEIGTSVLSAAVVLLIGTLIQMLRLPPPAGLVAPIFYLSGMTLEISGFIVGGFALVFSWLLALGLGNFRFLLPSMAVCVLLASFFNRSLDLLAAINFFLLLLPVSSALLLNQPLVFVTRESKPRPTAAHEKIRKPNVQPA